MPRIGRHPLKTKDFKDEPIVHQMVTVTTIVYIPMLAGYWQESLEVLKLFFESLYANTSQPFDLIVFDNGSCEGVQNYLLDLKNNGKIQYLIFSQQNLKKLGALNFLLSAARGEYIAYADSDVYFLPGWLDESLKVLDAFPKAGKVTALPIVGGDTTKISKTVFELAQADPTIEVQTGLLVPEHYIEAHRLSLGQAPEAYAERLKNRKDTLLMKNETAALLSGADFQFVMTQKAARAVLPLRVEKEEEYFDPIYSPVLEYRLDDAGFWQLSTPGYWVHHMGNHIPTFEKELPWLDIQPLLNVQLKDLEISVRIVQNRLVRRFLTVLHILTYRLLYGR